MRLRLRDGRLPQVREEVRPGDVVGLPFGGDGREKERVVEERWTEDVGCAESYNRLGLPDVGGGES